MIRHFTMMIGLVAAVCMFAGTTVAADEPTPTKAPAAKEPGNGPLGEMMAKFKLTDEQKAKADEILQAAKADAAKVEGRQEKMKIMRAAFEKIRDEVLTEEQRKGAQDLKDKVGALRDDLAAKFKFTDEQKAQAKEIMQAAKAEAAKAEGPEAKLKIRMEAFEKIVKDVLTDDQRKALEDLKGKLGVNFEALGGQIEKVKLTDDQKAKAKEIMTAAKADAAKAEGHEAKMKVAKDAFEKIKTDVLTDEQRKAVGELKSAFDGLRDRVLEMIQQQEPKAKDAPKDSAKDAPAKEASK